MPEHFHFGTQIYKNKRKNPSETLIRHLRAKGVDSVRLIILRASTRADRVLYLKFVSFIFRSQKAMHYTQLGYKRNGRVTGTHTCNKTNDQ